MSLTYQDLREQSQLWYAQYVAPFSGIGWNIDMPADSLQMHMRLLDAYERGDAPAQEAAPYLMANLLLDAQLLQHLDKAPVTPPPFPSVPLSFPLPDTLAFASLIPPDELISFLYSDADFPGREVLVSALQQDLVSATALVSAHLQAARTVTMPAADLVLAQVHVQGGGHIPDPDLAHDVLDDSQLAFLAGLYIAAFNRAPEHEGLMYWADALASRLAGGIPQNEAYKAVTRDIYWSGERHGEAGTAMDDAAYIASVYASVLGRTPDTDGVAYWLNELREGVSQRADFLSVFLIAALDASGDADYLLARIQVALHAAQAHVSGPGSKTDLQAVLAGVADEASAYAAIIGLDTTASGKPLALADLEWVSGGAASLAAVPVSQESVAPGVIEILQMPVPGDYGEFAGEVNRETPWDARADPSWNVPELALVGATAPISDEVF